MINHHRKRGLWLKSLKPLRNIGGVSQGLKGCERREIIRKPKLQGF